MDVWLVARPKDVEAQEASSSVARFQRRTRDDSRFHGHMETFMKFDQTAPQEHVCMSRPTVPTTITFFLVISRVFFGDSDNEH